METTLKAEQILLGSTDLYVSKIALGTVKIGRNKKVKYSSDYPLPSDREVQELFERAHELDINLIDTAPAYGHSELRIGNLPTHLKNKFIISTKVGETFDNDTGISAYDFSRQSIEASIQKSLELLKLDFLPMVMVHCDRNDLDCLKNSPVLETLIQMRDKGYLKYIGASTSTVEGGLFAVEHVDTLMVAYNMGYKNELPVIQKAAELKKGVLLKKALMSGSSDNISDMFKATNLDCPNAVVVTGTLNKIHLEQNLSAQLAN